MLITQIKRKKQHLCEITLSTGDCFLLDSDYCAEKAIKENMSLTEKEISVMKQESDYFRALSRSLWYIERGDLSQKGLKTKLKKAGFSEKAITDATARMVELGLVNDQEYALRLAEKLLSACVSRREAVTKMTLRGIDRDTANWALDEFECDPTAQIKALIIKKYKNKMQSEADVKKVFAALQRKGFNYSDIKCVLKEYSQEIEYSED